MIYHSVHCDRMCAKQSQSCELMYQHLLVHKYVLHIFQHTDYIKIIYSMLLQNIKNTCWTQISFLYCGRCCIDPLMCHTSLDSSIASFLSEKGTNVYHIHQAQQKTFFFCSNLNPNSLSGGKQKQMKTQYLSQRKQRHSTSGWRIYFLYYVILWSSVLH